MDTPSQERKGLRVLSIGQLPSLYMKTGYILIYADGGGVRGYSPVLILKKIREVMQSQMINHGPEVRSLPLYKYFDLIVGVSTGGYAHGSALALTGY